MSLSLPSIEAGTIIIGAATLFGAAVGSMVQFSIDKIEQRRRRNNLRQSLLAEINTMEYISEVENQYDGEDLLDMNQFALEAASTDVYDTNIERIGMLSEEEARAVTRFYTSMKFGVEKSNRDKRFYEEGRLDLDSWNPGLNMLDNERTDAKQKLEEQLGSNSWS